MELCIITIAAAVAMAALWLIYHCLADIRMSLYDREKRTLRIQNGLYREQIDRLQKKISDS